MSRAGIGYQTAYFWTCPRCQSRWLMRRRPRRGKQLRCIPAPEQTFVGPPTGGCGALHTSSGQREGIAPT